MGVLDYIKTAYDIAQNARNVELQGQLMDIKAEVLKLQEENFQLKQRNAELERKAQVTPTYREPSYYATKPDGTEDDPYCQLCFDADQRLIRQHQSEDSMGVYRHCLQCKTTVRVGPEREPNYYGGWR